jgi:hypothetical protein
LINFRYDVDGNLIGWAIQKVKGDALNPEPNKRLLVNVEAWTRDGKQKIKTIIPNTTVYAWNMAANWQTTRTMSLPLEAHKSYHPTAKVFLNPDNNGSWFFTGLWNGAISRAP